MKKGRQLATNWSVEVGYLGSQSRHLYGFQNLNQAAPGPLDSINSRRPYPNYGVLQYVNDTFKGHYNAGSVKRGNSVWPLRSARTFHGPTGNHESA